MKTLMFFFVLVATSIGQFSSAEEEGIDVQTLHDQCAVWTQTFGTQVRQFTFLNWSNTEQTGEVEFVASSADCITNLQEVWFRIERKNSEYFYLVQLRQNPSTAKYLVTRVDSNCEGILPGKLVEAFRENNTAISFEFQQALEANAKNVMCPGLKNLASSVVVQSLNR